MGKSTQGILGNWWGKVGNVVGRTRDGRTIMSVYQPNVHNPQTQAQMMQRAKFTLVVQLVSKLLPMINIGLKAYKEFGNAYTAGVKYNLDEVITGTYPSYAIDYTKVTVSKGNVALPYAPQASVTGFDLELSWTDNSGIGNAESSDYINVIAYNKDKNASMSDIDARARNARSATLSLPSQWSGDTVYVYMAAHRPGGNECSETAYLGAIQVG